MRAFHGGAVLAAAAFLAAGAQAQQAPDPASWREVPADRLVVMDTTKGRILIETAPEFAPNHVARFSELIRDDFYDGIIFHRVIDDFMAQTGDPDGTGAGGSGKNIKAEFTIERDASLPVVEVSDRGAYKGGFWHGVPVLTQPIAQAMLLADGKVDTWITHCPGVVSTARQGSGDPAEDRALQDTADSQLFLIRQASTFLDRKYTAWGRVVGGLDVVRALNVGTVGETPGFEPDKMTRVEIAADLPEGQRPRVWVMREDGPELKARIAQMTAEGGVAPDVCDIEVGTVVQDPGAG